MLADTGSPRCSNWDLLGWITYHMMLSAYGAEVVCKLDAFLFLVMMFHAWGIINFLARWRQNPKKRKQSQRQCLLWRCPLIVVQLWGQYSPFANSYLPITYRSELMQLKVIDTVTHCSLFCSLIKVTDAAENRQCPSPSSSLKGLCFWPIVPETVERHVRGR